MSSFAELRDQMIERDLLGRGLKDDRVIAAMAEVPREDFVPTDLRFEAYADHPLPIGLNQTISQPFTVAFMAEQLRLIGTERVLEVGTGCGYGAAILSRLAREVHSIERLPKLAQVAKARLRRLGFHNVVVHCGDGSLGLPELAPFDAIIATAAAAELPPPFAAQLAPGGRIVIPIGPRFSQRLWRFTKTNEGLSSEDLGGFVFVPMIGEFGSRRATDQRDEDCDGLSQDRDL